MTGLAAAASSRIGRRARAWAQRRHGVDPARLSLDSNRIYILPTRAGLIFGVIVFTMLLGAMNYNNNMGFALTFLLTGIGLVSIYHCHHNLAGLVISAGGANPVFAGESLDFRFVLSNPGTQARYQLRLGWDGGALSVIELEPGAQKTVGLSLPASQRGLVRAPRLQVSTLYPLGLLRAWSWINMDLQGLAYPRPAEVSLGVSLGDQGRHEAGQDPAGDDDYSGMRPWRAGDPPRRIAWKVLARTGQTLVSEYRSGAPLPVWIDWDSEPAGDLETRIARLARRVINAGQSGADYGLRVPGQIIGPARDSAHRHRCLECLALLPDAGPGESRS